MGEKRASPKAQFPIAGAVFTRLSHASPTNAATLASMGFGGYTSTPVPKRAHSGTQGETGGVLRAGGDDVFGSGIIDTMKSRKN